MDPLVRAVIALGLLVVEPLGLTLIPPPSTTPRGHLLYLWYFGAVPGAASFWLPRSALASALAACTGAATLVATMLLALDWSLGRAAHLPHPLAWMAATHGIANALGFALCTVVARRRLQRSHLADERLHLHRGWRHT